MPKAETRRCIEGDVGLFEFIESKVYPSKRGKRTSMRSRRRGSAGESGSRFVAVRGDARHDPNHCDEDPGGGNDGTRNLEALTQTVHSRGRGSAEVIRSAAGSVSS
jgi:hypothetical protein